ncbi:MAG: response regulator transcription factor [Lachnospiraceae bacterium]
MNKGHILVVDDDESIRRMLEDNLMHSGYQVTTACDGEEAVTAFFEDHSIQLIIMDVMMPNMDGFQALDEIRALSDVPVIMLSANDKETAQLKGFQTGADDYLLKPVSIMLLLAHINAILKRSTDQREIIDYGLVHMEKEKHVVQIDGEEITLTPKEFGLLLYFIENPDMTVSRETLLNRIWGFAYVGDTRTLDTHIKQLRKKMGKANYIKTVHGCGYRFSKEDIG